MTPVQIEAMRNAVAAMLDYIPPCPWNPFPLDCKWGRMIEDEYRREQIRKRRNHEWDDWSDNGW